jgi:two-component system NtrC family sensor kinase
MRHLSFLLFLFLCFEGISQKKVVLSNTNDNLVIGKYLNIYEDELGKLTAKEAFRLTSFKSSDRRVPNLGFTKGSFWVKFTLNNQKEDSNFTIQINQSLLDEVILYTFDESGNLLNMQKSGEKYPIYQRKHNDQYPIFDISIPQNKEKYFLLQVISSEQILLPVQVATLPKILERNKNRDLLFGIYFGIILAMMAYNFFIYFTVRDKSYLYYVLNILLVGLTQACLEGYLFKYAWPDNFWFSSRSVYYFSSATSVTALIFLRLFLRTGEFIPKFDRQFKFYFLLFGIIIVGTTIQVNNLTHNLTQFAIGIVPITILIVSIVIFRKGYRPAKFFIIAWIVLIVGIFIFVLKDAGVLEANFFTTYTLQIGSAIEEFLLSLALADRINILKREKEQSQTEMLLALKENEKLITEQNVMLEEKVKERTEELEIKNVELGDTLTNLKETQSQLLVVQKMASLGQLTAGIAHEINNPINFVSANIRPLKMDISDILELLNKFETIDQNDEKLKEKLDEIKSFKEEIDVEYLKTEINSLLAGIEDGAKRTAEIVKGLKNFSHLDESDIKMADINKGIESTLVLLRSSIPDFISIEIDLGDIPMIECYPGKLNQVFMNILNNAVQAIENDKSEKQHKLSVSTFESENKIHIRITDTGIGMTEMVKDKIFEPFFTTKDVGEGTGLGMSIVFGIIENHHGQIKIDSEPGKGTKIELILPKELRRAE